MPLKETTTYDPNGLIVGPYPVMTDAAVIGTAADLTRGAVLGRITATGKYILSIAAAEDGSEEPAAILLTDAAAASADADALILHSGEVDAAKLNFGAGHTAATVKAAFLAAGRPLFVRNVNPA
ncbi:head decoration protein [Rhodobacter sp. NTK016B]|uniref:Head decoration protein n=1 Tax=Pararhodobacter marinus TaxID=2184063 RepID=A0A2U2C434_9RHOB|nr:MULTISPECIES: head decoration protein [Paracoccaceae]MBN8294914.1 head decoration protein [Rhodobacter sp. NTK016B]PWE26650.1 head decoration protein [Pararhodobacter marinus]